MFLFLLYFYKIKERLHILYFLQNSIFVRLKRAHNVGRYLNIHWRQIFSDQFQPECRDEFVLRRR